jgi:hypothetical protein
MKRAFHGLFLMGCLAFCFLEMFADAARAQEKLIHRTPQGVEFEVTEAGLCAIRSGEHELARGSWSVFNGDYWFQKEKSPINAEEITERRFEMLDNNRARVTHKLTDLVSIADYSFDGEDVVISTRIENRHPSAALEVTGFRGLEFTFAKPPAGLMCEQHHSYFVAHGIRLCHPSEYSRIGGSYAEDGEIGVGVSPWRTGLMRTLILWDYTDWNVGKRETLPSRKLIYFAASPVPARGAQTFDLRLRVSPKVDWRHLLAPYREHFQATFGPVRYQADHRWMATEYLNQSREVVSRENPYGFHNGHRRIDTAAGAAKFCDLVIRALRTGNGQGVIVWGQGGEDPRGGMYRPDFDVLPPAVAAQWPAIAKRFKEAGLRLGVTARPSDMAVKKDWKQDQIIAINPDDSGHRDMLWRRFETMIERGCTAFYLDSFGDKFEDVKLMRWLREKLGPNVLTFAERQCDAIFPDSGGYSETTLEATEKPAHYRLWSGAREWEIYEWLSPGSQIAARLFERKGTPGPETEPANRWFLSHRITPLVPIHDLGTAGNLPTLQKEFLIDAATWKSSR